MARRRKRIVRRAPRRASFTKRIKRRVKSATSLKNPFQIDAMLYGALRAKVSNALDPVTSKIPLGTLSDEIGMGILNWMVAKKTSGMLKNIAMKGLVIENARVGEVIATQGMGVLGGQSNSTTETYTYG